MDFEPCFGRTAKAFPLDGSKGFKGPLETACRTGLDLHEHQHIILFCHDIQLEMTKTPVAGEHFPAHSLQKTRGRIFPFDSGTRRSWNGMPLIVRGGILRITAEAMQKF